MPKDETRRRMVVEEVQELQDLTQDISESVEKAEKIEEEIVTSFAESKPVEPEKPIEVAKVAEPVIAEEHFVVEEPVVMPEPEIVPELKAGGTNPLVIIIPGIFLLGALLGGIYFYQKGISGTPIATPSPTPVDLITNAPAATTAPIATLDLTKYPINIMNGSGIVGEAGKVKTLVETDGFKVAKTGNAASYDFTKTVIKAKTDVPSDFLSKLSTSLSKSYVLDTNSVLAISSPDSVQIIVGTSKAK